MGVGRTLGEFSFIGADAGVACQDILAEVDNATINIAKMPMELLTKLLVAVGKHLKDVGMICLVVELLTFFSDDDLCL